MPIPKTELNKRKREERKSKGLVKIEVWVKPENKQKIRELERSLLSNAKTVYTGIVNN